MGSERVLGDTESSDEVVPSAAEAQPHHEPHFSSDAAREATFDVFTKLGRIDTCMLGLPSQMLFSTTLAQSVQAPPTPYCNNYRVCTMNPVDLASAHMTTTCVKPH